MSNINKFLANILAARYGKDVRQSIHDAIKKVDEVADTAQGSATKSAASALASEQSAKTSMESALVSEAKAKQYMETAFSGTPEGYSALVEQVGLFDIQESTATTLYNTKHGGYRLLEMQGNTVQKTLSGKNLLQVITSTQTINGVTFTVNDDGSVKVSGTASGVADCSVASLILSAGTYIGSGCPSGGGTATYDMRFQVASTYRDYGEGVAIENSEDKTCTAQIYIRSGAVMNHTFYPMLRKADITDDTYEPYCGGIPSPNTEFPQVIENTFDCVEMMQGCYLSANGNYNFDKTMVCNKYPIPCKKGDVFTIELDKETNVFFLGYGASGFLGNVKTQPSKIHTYTIPNDNFTHLNFDVYLVDAFESVADVGKITLTINGKYVGCVKSTPNLVRSLESGAINSTNGVEYADTSIVRTPFMEVLPNRKLYSYGYDVISTHNVRVFFYDINKAFIGSELLTNYDDFTTPSNCAYVRAHLSTSVPNYRNLIISYLPQSEYRETLAYLLTDEPIRLGDKLFKDSDGLHKVERNMKEFGLENANGCGFNSTDDVAKTVTFYVKIADIMPYTADNLFCDKLENIKRAEANQGYVLSSTLGNVWIKIPQSELETLDTAGCWKWITTNAPKIIYQKAVPTIEVLDTDSQRALNALETFDTVTYIEVDSRVPASGIKGEFGTSQVGAYTLECLNGRDIDRIEREIDRNERETLRNMILSLGGNV